MTVLGRMQTSLIERRRLIWKHNSFKGHARCIRAHLNGMLRAATTTNETQMIAHEMLGFCDDLEKSLETRREGT